MDAKTVKQLLRDKGITEVPIVDMDYNKSLLVGSTGQVFREVATNLWVTKGEDVAYLGTGRHGGGIILRAMFLKVDDQWVNVVTGNNASFNVDNSNNPSRLEVQTQSEGHGKRVLEGMGTPEKLQAVTDLCASFSWAPSLNEVYERVCECLGKILHGSQVHFHLMNDDYTALVKCGSYIEPGIEDFGSASFSTAIGRTEWLKQTKNPIFMDYENPDPRDEIPESAIDFGMISAVSIPVYVDSDVIGIASIVYRFQTSWNEEDIEFLDTLSQILGTLVKRLFDTKKANELAILSERKMLSTEIHENISSLIGALSINAAAALASHKAQDDEALDSNLERLEITANETMRTLRDEMLSLRISLEKTDGLIEGIRSSLKLYEKNWGIKTELVIEGNAAPIIVPLSVSLQLTRILNECLSNIVRHADATHAVVRIHESEDALTMTVVDNGVGFDMDSIDAGHFGLKIMRERAESAGGTLKITSGQDGTEVSVEVPKEI